MTDEAKEPDLTLDKVDRALLRAREAGSPDEEIALLWAGRGELLGMAIRAEYLCFLMGVTPKRAEELVAILMEHGYIERGEV